MSDEPELTQARIVLRGEALEGHSENDPILMWDVGFLNGDWVLPIGQEHGWCGGLKDALRWANDQVVKFTDREHSWEWFPVDNTGLLWAANVAFNASPDPGW